MNTFKNYLIAILTGLLALTLTSQASHGASATSTSAKAIQYDHCLTLMVPADFSATALQTFDTNLQYCAKYKP